MKLVIVLLLILSSFLFGQESKIIIDSISNKLMLVGISERAAYQDSNFAWWFNSEYTNYDVDTETLLNYKDMFEGKIVKVVLGTWCSDSRREVPRMLKILDFINFPKDKIFFINVDREKIGISNEADVLNIELVPTFIFYDHGEEIGRIIETPVESLEKDLAKIITHSK